MDSSARTLNCKSWYSLFYNISSPWYLSTLFCNGSLGVSANAHNHGFFHYFSPMAITYFPVPSVDFTTDLTPTPCPTPQLEKMVYSVFSLSELCKFLNKWVVTLIQHTTKWFFVHISRLQMYRYLQIV